MSLMCLNHPPLPLPQPLSQSGMRPMRLPVVQPLLGGLHHLGSSKHGSACKQQQLHHRLVPFPSCQVQRGVASLQQYL
jgi:hypothetical protein